MRMMSDLMDKPVTTSFSTPPPSSGPSSTGGALVPVNPKNIETRCVPMAGRGGVCGKRRRMLLLLLRQHLWSFAEGEGGVEGRLALALPCVKSSQWVLCPVHPLNLIPNKPTHRTNVT